MKIRLLTIFALFLVATNMGWADTSTPIYVNGSSGNDDNTGADTNPVKTIAKAITLVSEGGTIYLATGEYTDDIDISKPLNLVGLGTDKPTQESTSSNDAYLTGKIQITQAGSTTIKKVKMVRAADTSNGDGNGMIEMTVANVSLTVDNCCMINSKSGSANTGAGTNHFITIGASASGATVNLTNSDLYMDGAFQRAITNRASVGSKIRVEKSQIIGIGTNTQCRPLALYNEGSETEIIDSKILLNEHGYAISAECANSKITIDNSEIRGFAALAIREAGMTIKIENSILTGRQNYSGESDGYGALVFEYGVDPTNNTVTINNSIITNEHINTASACMYPIDFGDKAANNTVTLKDSRLRLTSNQTPAMVYRFNANNNVLLEGNGNVFSYNTTNEPLTKANQNDVLANDKESCMIAYKADGSLMNAIIDWKSLSNQGIISFKDVSRMTIPEGTFELPQTFTLDKSLTIEGAGKDKTTIKGHIEVNPKQGETATLTAKGLTLEGNNNSFGHGIIGITGNGTGKVGLTDCKISGGALKGQTAAVGVRMESAGAELTMKNTDIDVYYYGLGLREKNQKVTINGGSITGRAAIMTSAGNLGGYLDPTGTSITATGTTFIGKTIAQGEGESYGTIVLQEKYNGVKGEFTNCTIETVPGIDNGKDAEKQMSALCVRSYGNTLNFSGSKLFATYAENNIAGINSKIHASVIQLGWHDADFKGDDVSTPSQNTIALTNCELKAKEGEKYLVTTFRRDINQQYDALTINGTAYSVNAGNVLKLYQVDKNGKFVDDNGKEVSLATSLASLKSIIASASDGSTIHLSGNITNITEGDLPIEIKKVITLEGNGYTLSGTYSSGGGTALKHLLDITSDNVVIRNLTVEKAFRSGINVTGVTGVILENIVSRNNASVGLTVNGSKVTATNFTTNGNGWKAGVNVDKGSGITSEPVFTFSNSSFGEAVAIYSDLADAPLSYVVAPANSGWTKHANQGTEEKKKTIWKIDAFVPTIATIPEIKVNMLEAGQTLSSVLLVNGVAKYNSVAVAGTFSWNNPAEVIKVGNNSYKVLFTPSDLIKYAPTECKVSIEAEQYYTVTTGVCQNGKVSITNGNVNNRYAEGTELTLASTADAGYKLKAGSLAGKMTVTEDKVITAEFEAIQQTVTLKVDGGNGSISVNGKTNHGGSITVQQGTEIVVQAIPNSGQVLESLSCTEGKVISKDAVTVDKDFTITAKFKALPPQEYSVQVTSPEHGKILLFDDKGNAIAAGSSVTANSTVSVLAVADEGYQLKANSLKNNSTEITNGSISVTANAVITAEFDIQQFKVESSIQQGEGSITLTKGESDSFTSGNKVNYGQVMTAKVKPADGYKLLSLLVNGKEIPDGGSFTVKAATTVKAVMRKLATITIDETAQTYVYDGTEKAFVVKTTPAGIGGFTVTCSGTHTEVGSYDVTISRGADDTYAAINKTISGGLVITQAEMKGVAIPTAESGTIKTTSADGKYTWKNNITINNELIYDAIFTPTNTNYAPITFSIPTGKGEAKKVTFNWGSLTTRSALLKTSEPAGSLQITTQGEGSIVILNGNSQLNSGDLYATQKIRLRAIPGANASANVTWASTGNGSLSSDSGNEVTFTLGEGKNIVTANFAPKGEPESPTISGTDLTYDGSIKVPTIIGGADWQITFKQGYQTIQNPIDAGDYDIIGSYPEDANYKAATDQNIGKFTIKPKDVDAAVTAASSILQGQSLAQSVITGTADADGTFEWDTDTKNNPITTEGTLTGQPVKFVPVSKNYKEKTNLSTSVIVTEVKGLTLRTLNLTVTNPDGGTVTMKLNDQEVASGATITKDDKITIETSPNSNYTSTVSVTGATNTEGVYTVGDAGNVEVKVTFTKNSTPGGGEEPGVVSITGVVLDSSSKTLAVGEEFKLTASVKPAEADQSVTWSSSDETVATVKKGTVKALKAGKATITATASDDTHYAECEVTVSVATGIDELIASTRVLGCDGYIMIEPMAAIETLVTDMMGRIFYHGRLTEKMQIPVSEGVYLVRLSNKEKAVTVKVIVR
ncbi:Ig-like domain-containing protein [Parabacteroides gordonii]|uniref:InlB B-repeat-containing protein n=1 Tax=Parabacteroides gordonii TaxID=574930 RepID=UPI0026F12C7F|nr:Ig-like domain-containing protein [Parabacteroides gordonii]